MPDPDVTQLLRAHAAGDADALGRLLPLVYDEVLGLAHRQLRRDAVATLNTVDLAHEAYARLAGQADASWETRAHFFAVAATVMRHVLVDRARARRANKRGSGRRPVALDDLAPVDAPVAESPDETILALNEALDRLATRAPRLARVVEARYFGGLSLEETAAALGVSVTTVKNEWRLARAWLHRDLAGDA